MAPINLLQFYQAIQQAAREATLDALKTAFESKDFSTETTLAALKGLLDNGTAKMQLSGSNVLLTTHQSAATANGNGTAATVTGYSAIRFRVSGTFSATVNFEASMDGSAWDPLPVVNVATGERITSTTAAGVYEADIVGVQAVRARISGYSSGSVTVISRALPVAAPMLHVPAQRTGPVVERLMTSTEIPAASSVSVYANIWGFRRVALALNVSPQQNRNVKIDFLPTIVGFSGVSGQPLGTPITVFDGNTGGNQRVHTMVVDDVYPAPRLSITVQNKDVDSALNANLWIIKGV